MAVGRLLTIIVVVIILYLLISWLMSDGSSLLPSSYPLPANKAIKIDGKKLKTGTANNFAMSCWFFVSNWDTHFGQEKVIYERTDSEGNMALKMALDKFENNLIVDVGTYADNCDVGGVGQGGSSSGCKRHQQCVVQNVPLQMGQRYCKRIWTFFRHLHRWQARQDMCIEEHRICPQWRTYDRLP